MPLSVSCLVHFIGSATVSQKNNSAKPKHPWFKRKGYLHFDFSLERREAEIYVTNPAYILKHRFSPLIHYEKITRKVQRDKLAERKYKLSGQIGKKPKLKVKEKRRNIFYASHIDGYIYSYYAHKLQKYYVDFLTKNELTSNVIAYRSIVKGGVKFSNIHFAREVFNIIVNTGRCHILCFDISNFFDRLSVDVLEEKWVQILGVDKLPGDHLKVYRSLVDFRYVEETQLIEHFGERFERNPRQHGIDWASGGSLKNRICSYDELRALRKGIAAKGQHLLKKKNSLDITGIPQGTAISGLLSNIFMLDFDMAIKQYVDNIGGHYRRYSDDICIIVPATIEFTQVEDYVQQQLEKNCTSSIKLNRDKTEKKIYQNTQDLSSVVDGQSNQPSVIQYLGFHFDGKSVFIRNSSISKDRGKIVQLVRQHKKRRRRINTVKVFKRRSPRVITPHDKRTDKGFVRYVERAASVHGDSKTILAQISKEDWFIKRAIRRERVRKPKK
jgi:RNA-directed DNA polymerase